MNLYWLAFCSVLLALTFSAGMYTEAKFHLASEVKEQNAEIIANRKGQEATEALIGTETTLKDRIASIPPLKEESNAKPCPVPIAIFNQLRAASKTANSAAGSTH